MTLRSYLGAALAVATAAGCAVKLNGKTYGGGGNPSSSGSSGGGGDTATARTDGPTSTEIAPGGDDSGGGKTDREKALDAAKVRKPPAAPSDPWAQVSGDQPKPYDPPRYFFLSGTDNDCSAAHDHCLAPEVWMVESTDNIKDLFRTFNTCTFSGINKAKDEYDDESWDTWGGSSGCSHADDRSIGYRTVPATKRHLVKGALAMAQAYPTQAPKNESSASGNWVGGTVESVDWKNGKMRLVGHREVYWISMTRVAVLSFKVGGKVEVKGKVAKEDAAVKVSEVVLPKADQGSVSDPWDQVGKDGQPKEMDDTLALENTHSVTCDAAHDHCLRPWAWFVEDPVKGARVAAFKKGKFHWVFAIDNLVGDDDKAAAYRTVPVKPENVKEGMHVYFSDNLPDTEDGANTDWWMYGDVADVQVEAGVFKIKGDDRYYPLETVRTPVVMWFPGEKAEKYE